MRPDFPEWIQNIHDMQALHPCPGKIPDNKDPHHEPDARIQSRNQKDIPSKDCENIFQDEAAGQSQYRSGYQAGLCMLLLALRVGCDRWKHSGKIPGCQGSLDNPDQDAL